MAPSGHYDKCLFMHSGLVVNGCKLVAAGLEHGTSIEKLDIIFIVV